MPTITELRYRAPVWTREYFERSVKYTMELEEQGQPLKEMRYATIMLEGDLKVRITAWDNNICMVRYGKNRGKEMTLARRFMKFRYVKEKSSVVA